MTYIEQRNELLQELNALEKANPITKVSKPSDVYSSLRKYGKKKQEHFLLVCLDGANQVVKIKVITKGILNRTVIHPREVFRPAIINNSASVIIAHNHPSGSIEPSREDIELTERMVEAGKILGIAVIDHLIITETKFYSFSENNKL